MKKPSITVLALCLLAAAAERPVAAQTSAGLTQQVRDAERAFARSMAARDFKAFGELVADEAVFFGRQGAQRGRAAVLAAWKPFFDGPSAPFSWDPQEVEVLDSGTLGLTSGPVKDPSGKQAGVFNSIWRREANGRWRVVFDKGCPPCDCAAGR
jgi:ketosteroid isomerase-like protein